MTFNDHEGSTKSYGFTREHYHAAVETDFVPRAAEIAVNYPPGESIPVSLHDGSRVILRKLDPAYDPTDRAGRLSVHRKPSSSRTNTSPGLIHIDETNTTEFHTLNRTAQVPLNSIPYESSRRARLRSRSSWGVIGNLGTGMVERYGRGREH